MSRSQLETGERMSYKAWSDWLHDVEAKLIERKDANACLVMAMAAFIVAGSSTSGGAGHIVTEEEKARRLDNGEVYGESYDDTPLAMAHTLRSSRADVMAGLLFMIEEGLIVPVMSPSRDHVLLHANLAQRTSGSARKVIDAILATDMPAGRKVRVIRHVLGLAGGVR